MLNVIKLPPEINNLYIYLNQSKLKSYLFLLKKFFEFIPFVYGYKNHSSCISVLFTIRLVTLLNIEMTMFAQFTLIIYIMNKKSSIIIKQSCTVILIWLIKRLLK